MIYESCIILSPQLTDPEIETLTEKLKGVIAAGGAEFKEFSRWGRRKLAYEIGKFTDGFFIVFFYKLPTPGQTLINLDRACKYDDNVLRCMTTTVEETKKGQPVKYMVPSPGYLSEFSMKLRPQGLRRRSEGYDRGPRHGDAPRPHDAPHDAPPVEGAGEAPVAAVATEAETGIVEVKPEE